MIGTQHLSARAMPRFAAWLLALVLLAQGALAAAHSVVHLPRCDAGTQRVSDEGCADTLSCALCLAHIQFDSAAPAAHATTVPLAAWTPPLAAAPADNAATPAPRARARAPPVSG